MIGQHDDQKVNALATKHDGPQDKYGEKRERKPTNCPLT